MRTSTLSFVLKAIHQIFAMQKRCAVCLPPSQSYFSRRKRTNSMTVPIFEVPNDGEVLDDCSCFFSLLKESEGNRFNGAPVDLPLPSEVALPCPLSTTPSGRSSL